MHVGIFADIEGSFGIWRMRQCRTGTPEWQYGRECLTADVNSVIQGAFEGGADRVTVKDTHDTGFNCLTGKLDPGAGYMGGHKVGQTFFGDILDFDLILYVAIHAASGTEGAFFPHTHYAIFSEVLLNGRPAGEMDIYGGYLGEFGIPIGFVSGDDAAVGQAESSMPWIESIKVDKRKDTYISGKESAEYLKNGRIELWTKAGRAVKNASKMKPLVFDGPFHFEVTFRSLELANRFNTWNFEQDKEKVWWDAENMIDGFELFNKLTFFSKRIYPFRRQFLFINRTYSRIMSRFFAPEPNREGAVVI